jgi:glycosyltransferase involved in cell wall biosynthesis
MIIGVDTRVLGNKIKSGIEEYTENLLERLVALDPSIKFKLFFSSARRNLPDYDWMHLPNVEIKKVEVPNKILFGSSRFFNYPKIDELIGGADVFFSPHIFLAPLSKACRRVTTFHDLSYLHFPEFFSVRQNFWHKFEMSPMWQSHFSEKIIAVSDSTKNDLIEKYKIDPLKIKVIYSGVASSMRRIEVEELNRFRIKKNLPENFILFLGKLEPRKNIVGLIKAFNILKSGADECRGLKLIIVGSRGWLFKNIFKETTKSPFKKDIIYTNHISDTERPYYYNLAKAFVYTSFFEGFGFPPLEAMACGVPPIASANSSIPEVIGKGGLMVNPYDAQEISTAIRHVVVNEALRKYLSIEAINRSTQFSWKKTAEETLSYITG